MNGLPAALEAWREVLGPEHVIVDRSACAAAETATFATHHRIAAIIRPGSREHVQQCMRIANRFRTPMYPISTGKNWGYGSRVPTSDGCTLMELRRLNRIVDFDEQLGHVTVQPGVSFRQLAAFLRERRSHLMMSFTGSTLDSSLIGNVVERGLGSGPYGDRFAHVCALEVVLPTGECIETGFARFPNAQAATTARWGVGPYLDGLFTQSSMGIVTRMTIWLAAQPRHMEVCWFSVDDDAALPALLDALQRLKMDGVLGTPVQLLNDYRLLATQAQFHSAGGATMEYLSRDVMAGVRRIFGIGRWNGSVLIPAPSVGVGRELRRLVENELLPIVARLHFVDRSGDTSTPPGADDSPLAGLVNTTDSAAGVGSVYWRKKTPPGDDVDPDRDACGVIWCAPAVPFAAGPIQRAVRVVEETVTAYRFEPQISINCISERTVVITVALVYDREVQGDDERAADCHAVLLRNLSAEGYLPYRLGIQSMSSLPTPHDDSGTLMQTLKRALDPNDILAPGRYDFRSTWPAGDAIRAK
jgi:4-cresol dehydrogenase (hydroxylating)